MALFGPSGAVKDSPELRRIRALPRRQWSGEGADPLYAMLPGEMTDYLRREHGEMRLRPIQAAVLYEAHDYGGAFSTARVGAGKTIISLLAPTVLESKRPLLLIPAKLKIKTLREMQTLRCHWQITDRLRVESYELLGRVSGSKILDGYQPDLIVADEAHKLKNTKAAVTRRVRRYMNDHPETRFIALSGTATKRSLQDYAHILRWCLGEFAPVPRSFSDLLDWSAALDEHRDMSKRMAPGALADLMNDEEMDLLLSDEGDGEQAATAARSAFRRRLVDTPGVVATPEGQLACSLVIEAVEPAYTSTTEEAFSHLRQFWETPDGQPVSDAMTLWRHARELACGFYYRWEPAAPQPWLEARRAWCQFVRKVLKHSRTLDSELQVAREHADTLEYRNWVAVRDTFKPNSVPVWIDDATLKLAAAWMTQNVGLCWVEHQAFGERLSAMTGVPYFGAGGKCGSVSVEQADARKSAIVSVASNSEGRNLQAWSKNLVVSAPPPGTLWEQMLGRTHRDGQQADEVTVDVVMGCIEQWRGFQRATADARYLEQTLGQEQKLLYADKVIPTKEEVHSRAGSARWFTDKERDDD